MSKISKFLLFFFVSLCLCCLIASQVHAETITYYANISQIRPGSGNTGNRAVFQAGSRPFGGKQGFLYLTATFTGKMNIQSITAYATDSAGYNCNIGTTTAYSDNNNQYSIVSAICPISIPAGGLYAIGYNGYCFENNSCVVDYGKFITFTDLGTEKDYTQLLTNIQSNTQDTITAIGNLRGDTQALNQNISTQTQAILNALTTQNTNIQNVINQNSNTINNSITDVNDSINNSDITGNNSSDSISGITSSFQSSNDWLLNIFTLPYTFITAIMNGVSDSCTPISLGTIFDYDLVMPCMNLNSILGNVWTTIVDVICAGVFAFAFRRRIHDFIFAIITLDRKAIKIGGVDLL